MNRWQTELATISLKKKWQLLPKLNWLQSTFVISKSKGLSETLRDIRTSTYQICVTEENN